MLRTTRLSRSVALVKSAASVGRRLQSTEAANEPLTHWDTQRLKTSFAAASRFAKDNKEVLTLTAGVIAVVDVVTTMIARAKTAVVRAEAAKATADAAIIRAEAAEYAAKTKADAAKAKAKADATMVRAEATAYAAEAAGKVAAALAAKASADARADFNKRVVDLLMHSDYKGVQKLMREHKRELAKLSADQTKAAEESPPPLLPLAARQ